MKVFIATDINIMLCDGKILANGKHSTILRRYYNAFGTIVLCARYSAIDGDQKGLNNISDIVEVVVEMDSLYNMFLNKCNAKIENVMKNCDLVIGRCPSIAAYKAADIARKLKKPYFAESMGCAWDAYWNHGVVGKVIAPYMFLKMKQVVWRADYALYVTREFLQNRYPCKNESVAASNVLIQEISEDVLHKRIDRIERRPSNKVTLVTTAAVNVRYKGQEYVIKAIPILAKKGIDVDYLLIGEGDHSYLESVAQNCGVADHVKFLGRLPLDEVFQVLDEADIYIQPSLQEGLPRSVIEAMSRGCPVIGARTAGIPELIAPECVVKRKSVSEIAQTVRRIDNSKKLEELAKQNFENAKGYLDSILSERRNNYYHKVMKDIDKCI